MPRPAPNLSPIERRLLDAIVSGMPAEVMLDWVAFRRLLAFAMWKRAKAAVSKLLTWASGL